MKQAAQIVFYDGLCRLCAREIDHYRKAKGADQLSFVDICAPGFDAAAHHLDPRQVHKVMHVRTTSGHIATGVDAFIAIWDALPGFRWLASCARMSMVRPVLNLGYWGFAKVRPLLPRKKAMNCEQSPYCDLKR